MCHIETVNFAIQCTSWLQFNESLKCSNDITRTVICGSLHKSVIFFLKC